MPLPSFAAPALKSILAATSATLLTCLLAACSGISTPAAPAADLSGNWLISSSATQASHLPALAGALTGTTSQITGTLHALSSGGCVSPQTNIAVTGAVNSANRLELTSTPFASGSVLKLSATLSSDNKLSDVAYSVVGGSCSFTPAGAGASASASATQYASVSGSYQGTFTDGNGYSLPVSATLSQTSQPDANGLYHLAGNATFTGSACLTSPVITDSTVTGNSLSTTYTQQTNTVVASGTFDDTASTLTISRWIVSGPCGPDQGTGVLSRQGP